MDVEDDDYDEVRLLKGIAVRTNALLVYCVMNPNMSA